MHISIYLGEDEQQAAARKQALEAMATEAGHKWNDKPSVGRWLCAMADEKIKEETTFGNSLPKIIISATKIKQINTHITTAVGVLTDGYALEVTLRYEGREVTVDALNLLVMGMQSSQWCIRQCEQLAVQLSQQSTYTPGQIVKLLRCTFQPIADLGIFTPPQRRFSTRAEEIEFHNRTGKGMVYLENVLYREWAIAYNAWIREHPALADDYGCTLQDENWVPVK